MFALTFLNPLLLWAIPLAAVPIVIHLLNRRRFQRVPWAAMEYLLAALKRNRKRLRMEQWLVLLLRTLAVLLLALVVARPQWSGGVLTAVTRHHVVVFDDSASMLQRSGSLSLWEKARDQVRNLADRLAEAHGGDLFSLVRTGSFAQPDLWAQRIGPDLGRRVGALLAEFTAGDGTMDLGTVLADTRVRAAAMKEAGATDYHLVGDLRSVDWVTDEDKPRPALLAALAAMDAAHEHLEVLGMGSRDADNLAIDAIRRTDRIATAGVPVAIAIDLHNHGLDQTPATELAVETDGSSRIVRPVPSLAPGESTTIGVLHTFHAAGDHRVEAWFPPVDHYLVDDRRVLALPVKERSPVLLVDGEPDGGEGEGGETMFLQVALDPGGDQPSGIAEQVVAESALAEVDLAAFDMVWFCNVPVPSRPVIEKLEAFVAAGGGLAIFVGAQVDPTRYDEALWRGGQGLLPLPLGEIAGDPDRREHLVLVGKDHPICGSMGEVLAVLCNATVLVKRYLTVVEDPAVQASVIARVRDAEGSPAIVTRPFGAGGNVVLFAFSADKHWSNWPDTDLNLVMAQQVHRFAVRARDISAVNLTTDGVLRLDLDAGLHKGDVTVRAFGGDGDERTITAVEPPDAGAAERGRKPLRLALPMRELRQLGAYEAVVQLHSGASESRVFARNPEGAESRLIRLANPDFLRIYPPEVHDRVTFREESAGLAAGAGEGEFWRVLAAAMLAALLLETLLAWRFGRR